MFHTRFAMEDSYNVLASFKGNLNGGAVHYFDGNYKEAKKMIDLGFNLVTIGSDQRYMSAGAKEAVSKLKSVKSKQDSKAY